MKTKQKKMDRALTTKLQARFKFLVKIKIRRKGNLARMPLFCYYYYDFFAEDNFHTVLVRNLSAMIVILCGNWYYSYNSILRNKSMVSSIGFSYFIFLLSRFHLISKNCRSRIDRGR